MSKRVTIEKAAEGLDQYLFGCPHSGGGTVGVGNRCLHAYLYEGFPAPNTPNTWDGFPVTYRRIGRPRTY